MTQDSLKKRSAAGRLSPSWPLGSPLWGLLDLLQLLKMLNHLRSNNSLMNRRLVPWKSVVESAWSMPSSLYKK